MLPQLMKGDRLLLYLRPTSSGFPHYGWAEQHPGADNELYVNLPLDTQLDGMHWVKQQPLRSLSGPPKFNTTDTVKHSVFHIPPSWWEPCIWWLRKCQWSKHGSTKWTGAENRLAMRITWMELVLAFQIQTGFKLPAHTLDLASQEKVFRTMVLRILKISKCTVGNINTGFKDAWMGPTYVGSTTVIIGHSRTGICRRPVLDNTVCNIIVDILKDALQFNDTRDSVGIGCRVKFPSIRIQPWKASILAGIYDATNHLLHGQREMEQDEAQPDERQVQFSECAPLFNVPPAKR